MKESGGYSEEVEGKFFTKGENIGRNRIDTEEGLDFAMEQADKQNKNIDRRNKSRDKEAKGESNHGMMKGDVTDEHIDEKASKRMKADLKFKAAEDNLKFAINARSEAMRLEAFNEATEDAEMVGEDFDRLQTNARAVNAERERDETQAELERVRARLAELEGQK